MNVEDVKQMGYDFFLKSIPPADLEMLLEVNKAGFEHLAKIPPEERKNCFVQCDFHLQKGKRKILVQHKNVPWKFDEKGNVWLAICHVSISNNKEAGNVFFKSEKERWKYSFATQERITIAPVKLSKADKDILYWAAKGYSSEKIAIIERTTVNTIKQRRKRLLKKLNAGNMTEVIAVVNNDHLF